MFGVISGRNLRRRRSGITQKHWTVKQPFIEPGSPWANGYLESFFQKQSGELLNRKLFDTLVEALMLIENWWLDYSVSRPNLTWGYRSPPSN